MEHYFRTNKIVLSVLGFWPYQAASITRGIRYTLLFCALSLHIPIFLKLIEVRHYFDDVLVCIPMAVTALLFYVNYIFMASKSPHILYLLNSISSNFEKFESSETEREILYKSAEEGRWAVTSYAIYTGFSTLIYCGMALVPPILDLLLPLNETRSKIFLAEVDYVFIEANDYFYFSTFHTFSVGTFVIAALVAPDLLLFSFIQHACGMFRILWYRLHKLNNMKNVGNDKMYQHAGSCIELYNKLLDFIEEIDSCFSSFLLISVGIMILMMSFQGAMIAIKINDPDIVIRFGIYYAAQIIRLLYISIPGQRLVDHSGYVIDCVYSIKWFDSPLKIQKLLLLTMMRGLKDSKVTIGKMFVLCIETFSSILKIIFQYLSVLTSTRN